MVLHNELVCLNSKEWILADNVAMKHASPDYAHLMFLHASHIVPLRLPFLLDAPEPHS